MDNELCERGKRIRRLNMLECVQKNLRKAQLAVRDADPDSAMRSKYLSDAQDTAKVLAGKVPRLLIECKWLQVKTRQPFFIYKLLLCERY